MLKLFGYVRSFIGYIIDLFTRYPLQFILVLVCVYAFWQKTRYDAIVSDYEAFRTSIQLQADMQKAKNEILRKQAATVLNEVMATHKESLIVEKLDRKRVEDKLKGSINEISNELNIYRSAVRLRNSATNSIDVSKVAKHTSNVADSGTNCNETLATVVDACKVTDYDYEALYNLYNKQCKIYGCE
jgi:type VI protein secretion system component VasK